MNSQNPILLVEDDQVDALTVQRAFKQLEIPNKILHVENGEEALDLLVSNEIRPCIILLDLNMPKMNGLEFLEIAKKDESIKSIPIIILTTSKEHQDRITSFNYSVAGYMVKPVDYNEFLEMVKTITKYWSNSELPD